MRQPLTMPTRDFWRDSEPKARATDPQTSHDAAASMKKAASHQCVVVLMALRELGEAGAEQIANRCKLDKFQVCRRLPELEAAGIVEVVEGKTRKTKSGRQERTWRAC